MCPPRETRPRDVVFALAVRLLLTNAPESIQSCAKFHPGTQSPAFESTVTKALLVWMSPTPSGQGSGFQCRRHEMFIVPRQMFVSSHLWAKEPFRSFGAWFFFFWFLVL